MEKELTEVQDELRGMQSKRLEIEKAAAEVLNNLQSTIVSFFFLFRRDVVFRLSSKLLVAALNAVFFFLVTQRVEMCKFS